MEKLKWQYFALIIVVFILLGVLSVFMKPQDLTDTEVLKADSNRYEMLKSVGRDSIIKQDTIRR
ncbi:MAG: hypothetical protein SGJ10_12060 [Bacteroidota bacterium]|nr:hypothetical protein [Bacteroidota bacterium]